MVAEFHSFLALPFSASTHFHTSFYDDSKAFSAYACLIFSISDRMEKSTGKRRIAKLDNPARMEYVIFRVCAFPRVFR
jgi:hypothetical protein